MTIQEKKMVWIKLTYGTGIAADFIWAVGLIFPPVFGLLTGRPNFNPDFQYRCIMAIGGVLMTGWTCLLIWALMKPKERKFISLLTAFPVVLGLSAISLIEFLNGHIFMVWIIIKCAILMVCMTISYMFAGDLPDDHTH